MTARPDQADAMLVRALRDVRVLDLSSGIAGAYCSKLLADAGADVVKVEAPASSPLRRWSATGAELGDEDAPFFQFLNFSKKSVVLEPGSASLETALHDADVVIEGPDATWIDASAVTQQLSHLVLVSISPWGRTGPWVGRPASDFTLQAESGSIGIRGVPGREPFAAGGRIGEFLAASFAAAAALAALRRARNTGEGDWIDVSLLETYALGTTNFLSVLFQLLGVPVSLHDPPMPSVETPSIEPTADGYVGFCTNSRQQFSDFLLLIGRPDLQGDESLAQIAGRLARLDEWQTMVRNWTRGRTTDEIVELATALRIPVAPVLDGDRIRKHVHVAARGVYRRSPDGSFEYPRPPYRITGLELPQRRPAPRHGEHGTSVPARTRQDLTHVTSGSLPLDGVRVVDLTNWWAGPVCTQLLAALGAEVIHVESPRKPDGMRMIGGMLAGRHERWWECSPFFLAANAGKKSVTLDLADPRGMELLCGLIERSDVVVENFTPRVLDAFGLDWKRVHARNPRCLMVRMPAFGLDGPWRDSPGFAQTMEQLSGLAWVTGHRDDQPRIQRGPCDPLAGMHAAFALLLALAERDARGVGFLVEATMVEAALNASAEQVIEFTAFGRLLERSGNRAAHAAPQGLYACRDEGTQPPWLALSVETDGHWRALCAALEVPAAWRKDAELATHAGRQRRHDEIDDALRPLFAGALRAEVVETLVAGGVPAATVVSPAAIHLHPQLTARGFFTSYPHDVVGTIDTPSLPFRLDSITSPIGGAAPTMGAHNGEVFGGLLGLAAEQLTDLEVAGVIGTRPLGL
jgi:crotonobetainyl-CoA:carnitine CoA-transferase CaiB-like acyl-CoA transferase